MNLSLHVQGAAFSMVLRGTEFSKIGNF